MLTDFELEVFATLIRIPLCAGYSAISSRSPSELGLLAQPAAQPVAQSAAQPTQQPFSSGQISFREDVRLDQRQVDRTAEGLEELLLRF